MIARLKKQSSRPVDARALNKPAKGLRLRMAPLEALRFDENTVRHGRA